MAAHGDAIAVVDAKTHRSWRFAELCRLVPRVSAGLAAAGVTLGQHVLFLTPNDPDFGLAMLSVLSRGAVCVLASPSLYPEKVKNAITMSGARWAIVHESVIPLAEEAFALLPSGTIRKMWIIGDVPGRSSLTHLMEYNPIAPVTQADGLDPARSTAFILFSSGTTGLPKGVMLSHRNFNASMTVRIYCKSIDHPRGISYLERYKVTLLAIPMYHIFGLTESIVNLVLGGKAVLMTKFSPKDFLEAIQTFKVTYLPIVPYLGKFLAETPLLEQYDVSTVKVIFSSGSSMPATTRTSLRLKMAAQLTDAYGMTEGCMHLVDSYFFPNNKDNAAGKVLPYVQLKVVDTTSGEVLGCGQEGEVLFRGPTTMLGYVNDPVATAATIDAQGWIHSGDLGHFDQDGFLFITGRLKDLIKVKGFQVSPAELEEQITKHPDVVDVAVVGVPHDRQGEAPRAYVVLRPGALTQPSHIQQFLADRVVSYKQLVGGVKFVDSLPRNPTGKVLKSQLKERLEISPSKL
ncbi:uncharacterized protein [Panulirus ornatus]